MGDLIERASSLFGVLAHPGRLHVLALLAEKAPRTASELQELTGFERTALSHQLRVLRDANLVAADREGRQQLYRLDDHHVAHIVRDALLHVGEVP